MRFAPGRRRHTGRLSKDDIEGTVALFHAGVRASEIGRRYGVTGRAIHDRLNRRGLHYPRRAPARVRTAIEMRRGQIHLLRGRHLVPVQMAAELGLRPGSLCRWMRQHMASLYEQMKRERRTQRHQPAPPGKARLPRCRPPRRRGPLQARRVCTHYLAGYSIAAIARHFRTHPMSVWRVLRARGVPMRPRIARSPMWLRFQRETTRRSRS